MNVNLTNAPLLSVQQKVAIVLIALGDKIAAEILHYFPEKERALIAEWIKGMEHIPQDLVAQCLQELNQIIDKMDSQTIKGGEEYLKKVLHHLESSIAKEKTVDFIEILNKADPLELAVYFQKEYPQTIAMILSIIDPSRASKIITEMPLEKQIDVFDAFVQLERLDQKSIKDLSKTIQSVLGITFEELVDFIESACQILENLQASQQQQILKKLEEIDPEAAAVINTQIFFFEDIQYLDENAIEAIRANANLADLRLALYDSPEELKMKFLAHIPQSSIELVDHQLDQLDSITDAAIQEAQHKIIQLLHILEKEDKIHRETIALQKTMISQRT